MRKVSIAEKIIDYVSMDMGHWSLDSLAAGLQKEAWTATVNTMLDAYIGEEVSRINLDLSSKADNPPDRDETK